MEGQGTTKTGEDESEPSVNLGLWLGGPASSFDHHRLKTKNSDIGSGRIAVKVENVDHDQVVEEREREREKQRRNTKCSVVCFTEEQLEELKFQILIFKYIVSGLPVPLQLLLPIWRAFSSSSSPPPLLGFLRLGLDRYTMDPEPGRCRRTDGKKWRCHQSVIPNEKYCERHMHRGRKRSRKLVEASTREASPNPGTPDLMTSNRNSNPNSGLRIKFPTHRDPKFELPAIYKSPMSNYSSVTGDTDGQNGPTRVLIRDPVVTNTTSRTDANDVQNNVGRHNSGVKERISAMHLSSKLDFSPKSVLQGGQSYPRAEKHDNDLNAEAGRCRRTDGKKWRCSNKVIPDQKYCAHHMNRGSKKPAVDLSASRESKIAYDSASSTAKLYGPERAKMGMGLDTNLNFSLTTSSADPQQNIKNNCVSAGDDGSGSITETTVTDDSSTDVSDMITPSP